MNIAQRDKNKTHRRGFSLVELVVVGGLCAAVFTTGTLVYRTVAMHQSTSTTYCPVVIGAALDSAYYAEVDGKVDSFTTPNYGMTTQARLMAEVFYEDAERASAVYPLVRGSYAVDTGLAATAKVPGVNYIHTKTIALSSSARGNALDTPEAFRQLLLSVYPNSTSNPFPFAFYRGAPATTAPNSSIYFIEPGTAQDSLAVRCCWDIDFVQVSLPVPGIFASVKRYDGTTLTHAYDCVYPASDFVTDFGPPVVNFERSVRSNLTESSQGNADVFKKAGNRPFSLVWWPDPAMRTLKGAPSTAVLNPGDPREFLRKHERQTSLMFTVPMFPPL